MTTEQIIKLARSGKTKSLHSYLQFSNLKEALESKGFKQSDEEIEVKIAEKSLKTTEKEDKVTTESKKEWK